MFVNYVALDVSQKRSTMSKAAVAGIVFSCIVLIIVLMAVGFYALRQRNRAERAAELSKPFGNITLSK